MGLNPKVVVLLVGTNNLYNDYNGGDDLEVARGVRTVVERLRAKLPNSKILLLGLLPRQNAHFCRRVRKVNAEIVTLADGKSIYFLDMGKQFLESENEVRKELFGRDLLHLNEQGYGVWAEAMQPLLDELLNAE
jgi:beta-glucosidase